MRIKTLGNNPPVALSLASLHAYSYGVGKDRMKGAWNGLALGGGIGLVTWALTKALGNGKLNAQKFGRSFAVVSTVAGIGIGANAGAPERWVQPRP